MAVDLELVPKQKRPAGERSAGGAGGMDELTDIREAVREKYVAAGRLPVSDVIADPGMDEVTLAEMAAWTGCVAGALTEGEFRPGLSSAGFDAIEIRETHRVHAQATAAIMRARRAPD